MANRRLGPAFTVTSDWPTTRKLFDFPASDSLHAVPTVQIHPVHFLSAWLLAEVQFAHLDILLEALYRPLECLLKNNASASSCCKGRWTC
jgi:hypothetical protein